MARPLPQVPQLLLASPPPQRRAPALRGCAQAPDARARIPALLAEGKLDRAARVLSALVEKCPKGARCLGPVHPLIRRYGCNRTLWLELRRGRQRTTALERHVWLGAWGATLLGSVARGQGRKAHWLRSGSSSSVTTSSLE